MVGLEMAVVITGSVLVCPCLVAYPTDILCKRSGERERERVNHLMYTVADKRNKRISECKFLSRLVLKYK